MRAVLAGRSLGYDVADGDACLISLSLAPHGAHQDRVPPSLPACSPGLPACLPTCPPGLPYLCHRQPCLGGVWGDRVGGVSCHGGWDVAGRPGDTHSASGCPLFGVVQPPPSVNGGTCRVSSQLLWPLANRGGCLPCTFLTPLVVSPTALHDSTSSPTLLPSPP